MTEVIAEKTICEKCGVDVREDTLFCYNCGGRVAGEAVTEAAESNGADAAVNAETKAALDDLAEKLKADDNADQLAKAAEHRRKARVSQRKPRAVVWEPTNDSSSTLIILLAGFIAVITMIVVIYTVVWK